MLGMYGSYEYKQMMAAVVWIFWVRITGSTFTQTFLHVAQPSSPAVIKQFPVAAIKVINMFCGDVTSHVKQIM
jgi:hypothetical protein